MVIFGQIWKFFYLHDLSGLTQYNDAIARKAFNPNSVGVKYFLIVLGGGGHFELCLYFSLLIGIPKILIIEPLGICHD